MHKTALVFIFGLMAAICLSLPAAAQTPPATQSGSMGQAAAGPMPTNNIGQLFFSTPKPGSAQQFEQGRKRHMDWHRRQNDAWTWYTFETLTGEHTGDYMTGTFGHNWKDFDGRDKFEAADTADVALNLGPYMASSMSAFYAFRPDLTMPTPGAAPNAPPTPYANIVHYYLKPEGVPEFIQGIHKINDAIKKANYGAGFSSPEWYQLVSGGTGPEFVIVFPRKSYAEMQGPDKPLLTMLEEVYGKDDAAATFNMITKNTRFVRSEFIKYRPELSYIPATR